jgi:hypothetical protein
MTSARGSITVDGVNRRQQRKKTGRRKVHAARTPPPLRTMSRKRYEPVKKAHIVPRAYQRMFAVDEQVAVHVDGAASHVVMNVRDAATRPRFYRRTRPDGTEIDDVEAALSMIEDVIGPVLEELDAGAPLTTKRRAMLGEFIAHQMVRGPAFFERRKDALTPLLDGLTVSDFRPQALATFDGDVDSLREHFKEQMMGSTRRMIEMQSAGSKLTSVIGSMHWQLLRFADDVIAYSDHPVVVWPWDIPQFASAPAKARLGPLDAYEVRAPLSPRLAVVATWSDAPDEPYAIPGDRALAGELNALVVGQADRQWMHHPATEPPIATGPFTPISTRLHPGYSPERIAGSQRRAQVSKFLKRIEKRKMTTELEIVTITRKR